ncbi:MAG: HupE/UreJ family protein, partial [Tsuneonella sp.]
GDVPEALFAFNVGVEAGQLTVVVAVLGVLVALARFRQATDAPAIRLASYFIGVTASYWLIDRLVA